MQTKVRKFMEVCGTHTMSIAKYGLRNSFDNIELISGPGCPVCVTASNRLEQCILLSRKDVIMTTFGDMIRVPAITSSLEKERSSGADIRIIYSVYDSLKIATDNPEKEIVFAGAGFETTAPLAAVLIKEAYNKKIKNISLFSMFKSIFPALELIMSSKDLKIDGFLLPGNVASVTGSDAFSILSDKYAVPGVVAGFSKEDVIKAVKALEKICDKNGKFVINEYNSVVSAEGNEKARIILKEVFDLVDDVWRGFGLIRKSGFRLNKKYEQYDADKKFDLKPVRERKEICLCGDIMKGITSPDRCPNFAKKCTPQNPVGPCMVSSEGVCSAYYKYGDSSGK